MRKYGIFFLMILVVIANGKSKIQSTENLCIDENLKTTTKDGNWIVCTEYKVNEGWHLLQIDTSTNDQFTNEEKMIAAGYIEGYIYHQYIDYHYKNIYKTILKQTPLKQKTVDFINGSLNFVKNKCNNNKNKKTSLLFLQETIEDVEYVETLCLILNQYKGLYLGYKSAESNLDKLSEDEFYLITMQADLEDIIPALEPDRLSINLFRKEKDCSGFVKLVNDNLIVGHNTHNLYTLMNRIYKFYNFNIKLSTGKKLNNFKFSSRPGDLNSKDDYYMLSNNMMVLETSLEVKNLSIYENLDKNTIPKWIRVNLANRLCEDNSTWINIFFNFNSGTHNNQWLIVDYNKFNKYKENKSSSPEGIIHLVEQTPLLNERNFEDVSLRLIEETYFASYNAPYFKNVAENLGIPEGADYNHARRKELFHNLSSDVKEIEDAGRVLRYHSKEDICDTIAPRCDLVEGRPFGAVDAKVTDSHLIKQMQSRIIYGPPHIEGVTQPFDFTVYDDYSHLGIPQQFNFDWITA